MGIYASSQCTQLKPTFVLCVQVVHGDESLVSQNPKHTLLLVYPGPDDMAQKALERYKGNVLLYVGEPLLCWDVLHCTVLRVSCGVLSGECPVVCMRIRFLALKSVCCLRYLLYRGLYIFRQHTSNSFSLSRSLIQQQKFFQLIFVMAARFPTSLWNRIFLQVVIRNAQLGKHTNLHRSS